MRTTGQFIDSMAWRLPFVTPPRLGHLEGDVAAVADDVRADHFPRPSSINAAAE
jgi:hypothetical protein